MQQPQTSTTDSNTRNMQHTSRAIACRPAGCSGIHILFSAHGVTGFRASEDHARNRQLTKLIALMKLIEQSLAPPAP
eukprot:6020005-Amphidinium_carterae.2